VAFDKIPWTQTAYIQPQMHPYDLYFYDPESDSYTVQRYLKDLKDRYGGVDAILMWPSYTNLGVDDRNQFEYFRSMPGGFDAIRNITSELKASGVRVLWPYNPWDNGTHRENVSDAEMFTTLLKLTGGDGINGDTMSFVPKYFWDFAVAKSYPIAFEPEHGGTDESLNWSTMSWGYWKYPDAPLVDRYKFISGGKFLQNICNRWAKSKTDDLQSAWFNGDGYESWENVWGVWNGITPYDGEAIRRVATMLRYFGKEGFLQSSNWEPHCLDLQPQPHVYASRWPLASKNSTLWTVVNRGSENLTVAMAVRGGSYYYDCYKGMELHASPSPHTVAFDLEAHGYGCVVESELPAEGDSLAQHLAAMRNITARSLHSFSAEWQYLRQTMVEVQPTEKASSAPLGTVLVPRGNFSFEASGVMWEGDDAHGVGVQYPWQDHPQRSHAHTLVVGPFFMDKFPVTNANYSSYLNATGFRPKDSHNWLKSWNGKPEPPADLFDKPVTNIGLSEAQAYCAWKGARLPTSYEWQYAAQSLDGRKYPWGSQDDRSRYPVEQNGTEYQGPAPVTAHWPAGDSPFGVSDLVGNVWQYTTEFRDAHTRAVVLRGGSNYRPLSNHTYQGHSWYFPQAKALDTYNKYFLMSPRYERASTIGFRCLVDASLQSTGTLQI